MKLVENGVGLPGYGFVGTSSDRQLYARKLAEKISKSKELTSLLADSLIFAAAMAAPPGGTPPAKPGAKIVVDAETLERLAKLVCAPASDCPFRARNFDLARTNIELRNFLSGSPRLSLEKMLLNPSNLVGEPAGYVGFDPVGQSGQGKLHEIDNLMKRNRPPMWMDPARDQDLISQTSSASQDRTAAVRMQERIAERATGYEFEGEHPDLKAMREAKEARMMREIPQMTKKEVTAVTEATARRLTAKGVLGAAGTVGTVVTIAAMPLVELIALAYEDRNQKSLECADMYPFVPVEGRTGNGAGAFTCRPVPFPNLSKKDRFLHSEYPKQIGMFLSLPDDEQIKLMNVKAGKYFGICDYYSRAFSDVFTGTKFCTGDGARIQPAGSSEGKTN